jgi:hypothetical protein
MPCSSQPSRERPERNGDPDILGSAVTRLPCSLAARRVTGAAAGVRGRESREHACLRTRPAAQRESYKPFREGRIAPTPAQEGPVPLSDGASALVLLKSPNAG